ncbi:type VII secretion integral membrane protein EccD [Streptomyces lydicus]|uniref:type VII secretion integral membrane protein EccD n=1 Tax=Streptomyces lydicus TaxID=47763 RepID=UPI0037A57278
MTTASSTAVAGRSDVCRLTVVGPERRADLAVPATVTVGDLLGVVRGHVCGNPGRSDGDWVLQRLGEPPLDPDGTPATLDLRDGEVLHLRPVDDALAVLHFDDVAEGVAEVVGTPAVRWRPELTRRLLLGLACLVLGVLAAGVWQVGPGRGMAVASAVVAVALGAACVVATRLRPDRAIGMITGLVGCLFAALAGATAARGAAGVLAPGRGDVALAGVCVVVAAAGALALRRAPAEVFGSVLAISAAAFTGLGISTVLGLDATRSMGVLAVGAFVTATLGMRIAVRVARLRVPQLPRTAAELQEGIEPEPATRVARRTRIADVCLTSLAVSGAAVFALALWLLSREPGWIGPVLATVLGGAVLLRTRVLVGPWQRIPMAVGGALGPLLVLLSLLESAPPVVRAVLLLVLLAAAGLLLVAARRMPGSRPLPVWGHAGDLLETWTAVALIPLLLQLVHVYAAIRSLVG